MAALIPNTTVEVLDPRSGQFTLPWRRFLEALGSAISTGGGGTPGPPGPEGPTGPAGPTGPVGSSDGLEFSNLADSDWSLRAGNGIQLTPNPSYGGPVTITAIQSSRTTWTYRANTSATSGYPGDGQLLWNNATQTSATVIEVSHLTWDGLDIDIILSFVASGQKLVIQDANVSGNFQEWTISGSPTNTNPNTPTSYWNFPVTLVSSGGTGNTNFPNNHQVILVLEGGGGVGPAGPAGPQGPIGATGWDGEQGESGWPVPGAQGATGPTGATGAQGPIGVTIPGWDGADGETWFAGPAAGGGGGGGTVTNIATDGTYTSGGPITTTGTITVTTLAKSSIDSAQHTLCGGI